MVELDLGKVVMDSYNDLDDKPKINEVELNGNKTLEDLGIQQLIDAVNVSRLSKDVFAPSFETLEDFVVATATDVSVPHFGRMRINTGNWGFGTAQIRYLIAYMRAYTEGVLDVLGNGIFWDDTNTMWHVAIHGSIGNLHMQYYKIEPNQIPTNNLLATVAGTPLDAVQGKVLDDKITDVSDKVNIIVENADLGFKETASGENIHLDDSADSKLVEFALYGKAMQNGTPTPQNPVDIEVAGSGGSVEVKSVGKNLLKNEAATKTMNGITYTVNNDGSIHIKGQKTSTSFINILGDIDFDYQSEKLNLKGKFRRIISPYGNMSFRKTDGTYFGDLTSVQDIGYSGIGAVYFEVISTEPVDFIYYPQIEYGDVMTEYQPYQETTATIPVTNFVGIPVDSGGSYTDQSGQQWICDEIVKYADGSGEYVQRVKKYTFSGTENTFLTDANTRLAVQFVNDMKVPRVNNKNVIVNGILTDRTINSQLEAGKGEIGFAKYGVSIYAYFSLDEFATVEELQLYLSNGNTTVYYELATPIRTPLTAEQIAEIEKLHTFYPVTNISNDADCGMKVKYIADAKSYIDNRLTLIEQAILNSI